MFGLFQQCVRYHKSLDHSNTSLQTVENQYKLEAAEPYRLRQYPEYVAFTTPDQGQYPVPDPNHLRIHAACSKIAHLSGVVDAIDDFKCDMDLREAF